MLVWVDGGVAAFDAGLETDPTVKAPQVVEFGDRRLYQLELTDDGQRVSVYPTVIEAGNVLQEVTATHEGWNFRVAFPSDEALEQFHAFFVDRGLDVELRRLCDTHEPTDGSHLQYGITDRQRETLVAAVDAGYLDIPRSCSLAELGEQLGISPNATSSASGAASRRSSRTRCTRTLSRRNARVTRPVRSRGPKSRQGIPGRATPAPLE